MTEIRVPTLGESVTEATIGKWFKHPGDAVAVDEPLVELETDKVTIEVPAPAAGVLADITAKDGDTVAVGAVLGQIKDGAGAVKSATPAAKSAAAPPPAEAKPAAAPAAAAKPAAGVSDLPPAPSVRRLSAESGLDASTVPGTGKDGRVTKGDM
ncbi:MAG: biotin/lipoyl-containing protein, partial [Xanthobacteraceae bacterium]